MTDFAKVTSIRPGANSPLEAAKWLADHHPEFKEIYIVAVPAGPDIDLRAVCMAGTRPGMILAGHTLLELAASQAKFIDRSDDPTPGKPI